MSKCTFLFGRSTSETELLKELLSEANVKFVDLSKRTSPLLSSEGPVVLVECAGLELPSDLNVVEQVEWEPVEEGEHPLPSSVVGQVLSFLARWHLVPQSWRETERDLWSSLVRGEFVNVWDQWWLCTRDGCKERTCTGVGGVVPDEDSAVVRVPEAVVLTAERAWADRSVS